MFSDLTAADIQPPALDSDIPEIVLSETMQSRLQAIFEKEESYARVYGATSVVKPDSNNVFFSNQWFYLAVVCKKYAQALYPYCKFFDLRIRNNQDIIKDLASGRTDNDQFSALFDNDEDKDRMLKFIQADPDFRPGKALLNIRDGNKVTTRSCKDIFGSCVLKKIAVPDASSGYLGNVIYYLAEYGDVYDDLETELLAFMKEYQSKAGNEADSVTANAAHYDERRIKGGTNIILYGVPGAGKSWTIKHEYCDNEDRMERLVFHPDYTYSDFVGQILPKVSDDGSVSYEFSAGPFTKLVRKAYINPEKMYYLVIEEVNRGNAPAIFGDVFQLLDRDKDGNSEYEITNADIAKIVYLDDSHKVSIPSNMCILCTMNTSDQNVFTLDTAFQRRWSMRLIRNRFHDEEDERRFAGTKILDTDVTWEHFFTEINNFILGKNIRMTSSEDKRLGTHFVSEEDLAVGDGSERQISRFPEKVLKYLWDDAFKFTKEDVFDLEKVKSLEDVIDLFVTSQGNSRFLVFKENIYNSLVPKSNS
ncbi:McrB family protein [Chordicoccus furentiruminis]|uniref:McrB family protein n=1 Tax=Chordicoccus furentiruminis TaxID=2709410 RepID=UPI0023A892AD|nr:AAA family ATPase [Chordicoccus furentiruminis]